MAAQICATASSLSLSLARQLKKAHMSTASLITDAHLGLSRRRSTARRAPQVWNLSQVSFDPFWPRILPKILERMCVLLRLFLCRLCCPPCLCRPCLYQPSMDANGHDSSGAASHKCSTLPLYLFRSLCAATAFCSLLPEAVNFLRSCSLTSRSFVHHTSCLAEARNFFK